MERTLNNWTLEEYEREISILDKELEHTPDDVVLLEYYYWIQLEKAKVLNQIRGVA
jgi:hypothetical protein